MFRCSISSISFSLQRSFSAFSTSDTFCFKPISSGCRTRNLYPNMLISDIPCQANYFLCNFNIRFMGLQITSADMQYTKHSTLHSAYNRLLVIPLIISFQFSLNSAVRFYGLPLPSSPTLVLHAIHEIPKNIC